MLYIVTAHWIGIGNAQDDFPDAIVCPENSIHPKIRIDWTRDVFLDYWKKTILDVDQCVAIITYDSLILLTVQTLIANETIPANVVRFVHYDNHGQKFVVTPDKDGSYGDWPGGYDSVYMEADSEYLDEADKVLSRLKDVPCDQCHGTGLEADNISPCEACCGDGYQWWK